MLVNSVSRRDFSARWQASVRNMTLQSLVGAYVEKRTHGIWRKHDVLEQDAIQTLPCLSAPIKIHSRAWLQSQRQNGMLKASDPHPWDTWTSLPWWQVEWPSASAQLPPRTARNLKEGSRSWDPESMFCRSAVDELRPGN